MAGAAWVVRNFGAAGTEGEPKKNPMRDPTRGVALLFEIPSSLR